MKNSGWHRALNGWLWSCVLAIFISGCGGGGSSTNNNTPTGGSTSANTIVIADAGDIVGVRVGEVANLDGSASSNTSNVPLTYMWSFSSKPAGSTAQLNNPTSVNPSFVPDIEGTYMVQLVVSAGRVSSQRAIALVEASVVGNYTGIRVHLRYPSRCADCHDGRYANGDGPIDPVPTKSGNHLATSNMCEACHTTFGFNLIRYVDHREVFGNCSDCHDGVKAVGKSPLHVETNAECDNCHTDTTTFLPLGPDGKYDHSNITRACSSCHDGSIARGKHDLHVATPVGTDCVACHVTTAFAPAFVDHTDITSDCATCHDDSTAPGMKLGHPVMAVDCSACHGTTTFSLGGVFNHRIDPSVQPCSGCHTDDNSINARGKASAVNHVQTTEDCGVCHGTGGGSFADGIYDHTGIVDNCNACHGPGGDGSGPGMSVNHMPTALDCSACHTPGTFVTGIFDHDLSVYNPPVTCVTCHNGIISAGKHVTHIPTNPDDQNCADCHSSTTTFKGAVFNHTGIDTTNCAMCHDGNIATGMTLNHMPTTRDCSSCHIVGNYVDFTGATFDHVGINNNDCASCHNGVIAITKIANHIPSQPECSQCHTDTNVGGFVNSIFLSTVHPGMSTGCEGCHKDQFLSAKPNLLKATGHLPTIQDCHFCHTNTAFTPQIFTHAGITGNCTSCHDGNFVTPAGALGKTPTPPHPDTTADCGTCHAIGANFADGIFDHTGRVDNCNECHGDGAPGATTKKNAGHVPTTQDCSVCHVPGTFTTAVFSHQGIVDNCSLCHDGSVATATVKSNNHLPTTEDCSVCHNTTAFAGAKYDHTGIVSGCATCHDGVIARGKHGTHVPTNDDCSVCHLTTGFIPGTFAHVGIVDNCQSCHDGFFARGKIDGHVPTNQDCGVCHNTTAFKPATFDHSTVSNATRCDSCHGVTATGKDAKTNPPHLATNLDCRSCHTTATFVGGTWVHDDTAVNNCSSCHGPNGGAREKPLTHLSTDLQCDTCHVTTGWAPTTFRHDPNGNYPGDHRRNPSCSACHGSIITMPFAYPAAQYAPFCAACHASDFTRKGRHNGGENGTVEQNKDCSGGGSGCHRVSDSEF